MISRKRIPLSLTLLLILCLPAALFGLQEPLVSHQSTAVYTFGQAFTFQLQAETIPPIEQATLFFRAANMVNTFTVDIPLEPSNELDLEYTANLTQVRLAPFAGIDYWWRLTAADGSAIEIPPQTIVYEDNQFRWQAMEQDGVTVHWSGNDPALGQAALDAVAEAMPRLQAVIPQTAVNPLSIYIYPASSDLRAALRLTGRDWVGSHADPELGVLLTTAVNARTASADLRQSLPHEMTHLLLYQAIGSAHKQLPVWFNEGLATHMETARNPNYAVLLETAVSSNATIPFADLCANFPAAAPDALLAYAQSDSLIRHIQSNYGNQALSNLIAAYADGADCSAGVERALGVSLAQLEEEWLLEFQPQRPLATLWTENILWLILLAGGFVLAGLIVVNSK